MQYRKFGRFDFNVSEIGYGMWGMGGDWKGSSDAEALESLSRAIELGLTFFDTAWGYGSGHSERLYQQLRKNHSDAEMIVATKIPPKNFTWPSRRGFTLDDTFPPDHVREYTMYSLENLGVDSIDLQQLHVWEDEWIEDERLLRVLDDLKSEGLVKGIGISLNRWEPWNGVKAVKSGVIDVVQVIYNIFDQNPEDELFPACRQHNVAVIARVPFDEGTLTGKMTRDTTFEPDDWRASYFVPENLIPAVEHADALKPLIPEGMTMAEMALRFILANDDVTTVIPGMRRIPHVEMNIATSDGNTLPADLLEQLKEHRWDREPTEWSQ